MVSVLWSYSFKFKVNLFLWFCSNVFQWTKIHLFNSLKKLWQQKCWQCWVSFTPWPSSISSTWCCIRLCCRSSYGSIEGSASCSSARASPWHGGYCWKTFRKCLKMTLKLYSKLGFELIQNLSKKKKNWNNVNRFQIFSFDNRMSARK